MAFYEHVLIARPDVSPQQVESITADLTTLINELGGKVVRTEYWGLRNLAYRMNKSRKGHYALLNIEAPPAAIAEIERKQRINEDIMRCLTIRVEELDDGPSPVLARREKDEKRRTQRSHDSGPDLGYE